MTGAIFLCHSCQAQRERESMPRQARHDTIMLPCHCELTPIRHCERSEAISDGLPRVHTLAKTERGRSMVEMLGVLTIMGLVGMVGVKMYTNAMNKHRANELIYEAQKRATMVAMQITSGQENLSVANFTNPTGYTFGVEKNPNNENQFNITITGVDSKVCEHMKTAVGPATPIRVISEFCDKLTFNNDLSTTGYTSDYTTDATGCQQAGYTWCAKGNNGASSLCSENIDCCASVTYDEQCQTCDSTTGQVTDKSGSCTYTYADETTASSTCNAGFCLDPAITTTTPCLTNADCGGTGSGYYCKYPSLSSTQPCEADGPAAVGCAGETHLANCGDGVIAGTCTKIGTVIRVHVAGLGQVIIGPIGQYDRPHYWSVKNWCEAQGRHLANVEDFQAYRPSSEYLIETGGAGSNACAKGKKCGAWSSDPYKKMWNGNTLTDDKDENGESYRLKFSPIIVDLARQIKGEFYNQLWTASHLGSTQCKGFVVSLDRGEMASYSRVYGHKALCR